MNNKEFQLLKELELGLKPLNKDLSLDLSS